MKEREKKEEMKRKEENEKRKERKISNKIILTSIVSLVKTLSYVTSF